MTLKMAFARVVETSVANNSPSQDSNHPDDHFNQGMLLLLGSNHFHCHAFTSHAFEFCRIKPDGDILMKNEK